MRSKLKAQSRVVIEKLNMKHRTRREKEAAMQRRELDKILNNKIVEEEKRVIEKSLKPNNRKQGKRIITTVMRSRHANQLR